jgi:hypothetical protein
MRNCGCDTEAASVGWEELRREISRPDESLPFMLGLLRAAIPVILCMCDMGVDEMRSNRE